MLRRILEPTLLVLAALFASLLIIAALGWFTSGCGGEAFTGSIEALDSESALSETSSVDVSSGGDSSGDERTQQDSGAESVDAASESTPEKDADHETGAAIDSGPTCTHFTRMDSCYNNLDGSTVSYSAPAQFCERQFIGSALSSVAPASTPSECMCEETYDCSCLADAGVYFTWCELTSSGLAVDKGP